MLFQNLSEREMFNSVRAIITVAIILPQSSQSLDFSKLLLNHELILLGIETVGCHAVYLLMEADQFPTLGILMV